MERCVKQKPHDRGCPGGAVDPFIHLDSVMLLGPECGQQILEDLITSNNPSQRKLLVCQFPKYNQDVGLNEL